MDAEYVHVSKKDMDQTKKSKCIKLIIFFSKMVSVLLGRSYHIDVSSSNFFFIISLVLYQRLWKRGKTSWVTAETDSILIEHVSEPRYWGSTPWTLLCWLWLEMTSPVQDGSPCSQDILASLLLSGRKWRHAVHLHLQPMVETVKRPLHPFWFPE